MGPVPKIPGSSGTPPPPPASGLHPLVKIALLLILALLAIPALAYGAFLAAVLIYAAVNGPIRWN